MLVIRIKFGYNIACCYLHIYYLVICTGHSVSLLLLLLLFLPIFFHRSLLLFQLFDTFSPRIVSILFSFLFFSLVSHSSMRRIRNIQYFCFDGISTYSRPAKMKNELTFFLLHFSKLFKISFLFPSLVSLVFISFSDNSKPNLIFPFSQCCSIICFLQFVLSSDTCVFVLCSVHTKFRISFSYTKSFVLIFLFFGKSKKKNKSLFLLLLSVGLVYSEQGRGQSLALATKVERRFFVFGMKTHEWLVRLVFFGRHRKFSAVFGNSWHL